LAAAHQDGRSGEC